jgi:sigma-B regulation protein RsbU (phosphoserine phosphatase)
VTTSLLTTGWHSHLGQLSRRVDDAARFARAFSSQRSREQILASVLELALRSVRAEVGAIVQTRGSRMHAEASLGLELDVVRNLRVADRGVVECVVASGQPVVAEVQWDQPGAHGTLHIRSLVAVPMHSGSEPAAVMLLAHGRPGERFSQEDQAVAALLASMAMVSIENAEWLHRTVERQCQEQQLGTARLVQRSLLPDPGRGPDWLEWESYYRPATAVGGDYFDIVPLPNDTVAVAVGDVCDHGVPAALLMTSVRALLRALCLQGLEPVRVLEEINRALCQDPSRPKDLVVSLFIGLVNVQERVLRYANAGHPFPLLWDAARLVPAPLPLASRALGLSKHSEYSQSELPMGPGFRLFLYSDGLTETASGQGELFGLPRLRLAVSEQVGLPGADFILSLRKRLESFSGMAESRDDLAMLWLGERAHPR